MDDLHRDGVFHKMAEEELAGMFSRNSSVKKTIGELFDKQG